MLRPLRSVFKLWWLLLRELFLTARSLASGHFSQAAMHTRILACTVHEDLAKCVAALQRVVPLWHPPNRDIDRILIVKLDRIGDMVNTTPVFDALREAYPHARLDIVGHPGPLSLLEGDERIGECIPYKTWLYHPLTIRPGGLRTLGLLLKLLWRRYPLVVYLRGSFPFLWMGLTSRLAVARFVPGEPVVTRYLKALEPLLGPIERRLPRLHIDPGASDLPGQLRNGEGLPGPRIVIHASASAAAKVWPANRFAALADQLVDRYAARVHILAGPEERPILERIGRLAQRPHSLHCSLRLPEVVDMIAACDLFIGNDSGLSHIAASVGTPLVVVWGPANLNMARPEAPPERCVVLYHELPCREGCPETHCINPSPCECLLRTEVEDVLTAVHTQLEPAVSRWELPVLPNLALAGAAAASSEVR